MIKKALALTVILIAGCSQSAKVPRLPGSSKRLPDTSITQAFDAAQAALQVDYRIDQIDRDNHILRTVPVEYTSNEPTARLSDQLVRAKNLYRKLAIVRITASATGRTIVHVRVEVQRYDTHVRRAFAYQRQSRDLPSDTSIAETASAAPERREAWTVAQRDRAEEQKILKVISAVLNPPTP